MFRLRHDIQLWHDGLGAVLDGNGLWEIVGERNDGLRHNLERTISLIARDPLGNTPRYQAFRLVFGGESQIDFEVDLRDSKDGENLVISAFKFEGPAGLQLIEWALLALVNPRFEGLLADMRTYERRLRTIPGDCECPAERLTADGVEIAGDWLDAQLGVWPPRWGT